MVTVGKRLRAIGDPVVAGAPVGARIRTRIHPTAAEAETLTAIGELWRDRWNGARMFLTADGESGKAGGNETIRVDESGRLRIKIPAALADDLGTHLVIAAPVQFNHRAEEWWARTSAGRAVRYDISYDPDRGRWYVDTSWKTAAEPLPELDELRAGLRQHRRRTEPPAANIVGTAESLPG
jgi:hypothetical protein